MAYREVPRMETQEIIRRWQAGNTLRQIAAGTGLSRDTVRKYVAAARGEGLSQDGLAPDQEQLRRLARLSQGGPQQSGTPGQGLLVPWADQIYRWLTGDRLQMTRIHELLLGRGCPASYPSLRRFILKRNWRKLGSATVRMEDTEPGEVAEADFGHPGLIPDPETGRRKAVWAMVIVLGHSRHCFVWRFPGAQRFAKRDGQMNVAWTNLVWAPPVLTSAAVSLKWSKDRALSSSRVTTSSRMASSLTLSIK